jgi:hypothetical protein
MTPAAGPTFSKLFGMRSLWTMGFLRETSHPAEFHSGENTAFAAAREDSRGVVHFNTRGSIGTGKYSGREDGECGQLHCVSSGWKWVSVICNREEWDDALPGQKQIERLRGV